MDGDDKVTRSEGAEIKDDGLVGEDGLEDEPGDCVRMRSFRRFAGDAEDDRGRARSSPLRGISTTTEGMAFLGEAGVFGGIAEARARKTR